MKDDLKIEYKKGGFKRRELTPEEKKTEERILRERAIMYNTIVPFGCAHEDITPVSSFIRGMLYSEVLKNQK